MQPSDEIKERLDIVDVIRDYIPLKASGMNFSAKCPFHNEKSASFMVSPDKQIWHCFGCSKGGDVFSFVMEMEGLNFVETLRLLAPKAGVTLKQANPEVTSKRNKLLDILDLSTKYFNHILLNEKIGERAKKYLLDRGLNEEGIKNWQIGYSLDSWDALFSFLKKRGYSEEDIFAAGMITKKQNGQGYYDRFRGRIMFPINDVGGNTVAFTARVSPEKEATEKMGKYINSPQTDIYDKSKIVFGLDKAKQEVRQKDYAIIMEGQMDVITAHENGFKNAVASSGTAFTSDQLKLLKRYSKNIILAFDMDAAGDIAAERAIKEAQSADMNIKVVEVPDGKDPDDCIKNDLEAWKNALKNAKHVVQYYIDKTFSKFNISDITERVKGINEVNKIIVNIGNKIERDYWIKNLGEETDTKEEDIRAELAKLGVQDDNAPIENSDDGHLHSEESREDKLSKSLLVVGFKFPSNIEYILNNVETENLGGSRYKELYKNLAIYYNNTDNAIDYDSESANKDFYSSFRKYLEQKTDESQPKILDELVVLGDKDFFSLSPEEAHKEIIAIIKNIRQIYIVKRKEEIGKLIGELEKNNGNREEIQNLMDEFKLLSDELRNIS